MEVILFSQSRGRKKEENRRRPTTAKSMRMGHLRAGSFGVREGSAIPFFAELRCRFQASRAGWLGLGGWSTVDADVNGARSVWRGVRGLQNTLSKYFVSQG